MLALIAFMPTKGNRAIGSLDYSDPERRKLAKHSRTWRCETCGPIKDLLKQPEDTSNIIDEHQCEAGALHANDDHVIRNSQSDRSRDSGSDSEGEFRDSLTDSHRSASSSDVSETDRMAISSLDQPIERSLAGSTSTQPEPGPDVSTTIQATELDNEPISVASTSGTEQTTRTTGGRSYPPLVFTSIFILLFLLIVRRIVIIIQT